MGEHTSKVRASLSISLILILFVVLQNDRKKTSDYQKKGDAPRAPFKSVAAMLELLWAIAKIIYFFSSHCGGFINKLVSFLYFNHPLLPMKTQNMKKTVIITVAVVLRHHQSSQLNVTLSDVTHYLCNVTYVVSLPILLEIAQWNQKILRITEIRSIHLIKHILQIYRMFLQIYQTFLNAMYQMSMLHMLLITWF